MTEPAAGGRVTDPNVEAYATLRRWNPSKPPSEVVQYDPSSVRVTLGGVELSLRADQVFQHAPWSAGVTADEIVADLQTIARQLPDVGSAVVTVILWPPGVPFLGQWRARYPRRVEIRRARQARKQRRGW